MEGRTKGCQGASELSSMAKVQDKGNTIAVVVHWAHFNLTCSADRLVLRITDGRGTAHPSIRGHLLSEVYRFTLILIQPCEKAFGGKSVYGNYITAKRHNVIRGHKSPIH